MFTLVPAYARSPGSRVRRLRESSCQDGSGHAVSQLRIAHDDCRKNDAGQWIDRPRPGERVSRTCARARVIVAGRTKWREYTIHDSRREAADIVVTSLIPVPPKAKATPLHEDDYRPDIEDGDSGAIRPQTLRIRRPLRPRDSLIRKRSQILVLDRPFADFVWDAPTPYVPLWHPLAPVFATGVGSAMKRDNVRSRILRPAVGRAGPEGEGRPVLPDTRSAPLLRIAPDRWRGVRGVRRLAAWALFAERDPQHLRAPVR